MEIESREKLAPAMDRLRQAMPEREADIQDLHAWLLNSQAQERHRMNPYRIHQSTGIPLKHLVQIFLVGTGETVFELRWEQHCPHCNMITAEYKSLASTSGESSCPMCNVDFTVDFRERVEVTFSLHPAIEYIDLPPFCMPPESLKPLTQLSMAMGEVEAAEFAVGPGVYRYYCPITSSIGRLFVESSETPDESDIHIQQLENRSFDPPEIRIKEGQVFLRAENSSVPISGLIIHEDKLADPIPFSDLDVHLTGLEIIHYPEFREVFGDDALSERERMTISGVTFLFTDINGSTEMYDRLGDVEAYNIVRDHYQILIDGIEDAGGIIVRTIGDSVMASFLNNGDALAAVFASMEEFQNYNEQRDLERQVNLKIGMHQGPAILVNLNERLDYFGGSVNKAARIQSLAASQEIAFSEPVMSDPSVKALLLKHGMRRLVRRQVSLKGLGGLHPVYFLSLNQSDG